MALCRAVMPSSLPRSMIGVGWTLALSSLCGFIVEDTIRATRSSSPSRAASKSSANGSKLTYVTNKAVNTDGNRKLTSRFGLQVKY